MAIILRGFFVTLIGVFLSLGAQAVEAPYAQPDDTWISIDGTVEAVTRDAFTLDYGQGFITVEMDDGDRDADGYKLLKGDRVTVTGVIDDDFFETTTIEASSVYVENAGTYFYASAFDEEDAMVTVSVPVVISQTVIQGKVTGIEGDEFTLDTGASKITVEVDDMPYNPLDDEGYQKIKKGDRVSVTGNMDKDLFEGRVFEAETVTTLSRKKS